MLVFQHQAQIEAYSILQMTAFLNNVCKSILNNSCCFSLNTVYCVTEIQSSQMLSHCFLKLKSHLSLNAFYVLFTSHGALFCFILAMLSLVIATVVSYLNVTIPRLHLYWLF